MKSGCLLFLILLSFRASGADTLDLSRPFIIQAGQCREKMTIDGALDESIWQNAPKASAFQEHWPQNARVPLHKTEAMIASDDHSIYVAFTCYDTSKNFIIQTLKRDFQLDGNDAVAVILDPTGQKNFAYAFLLSPAGVQGEALINQFEADANWDSKWFSAVKIYEDRWTAELAIPLHILRYDPNLLVWNVNFLRGDVKNFRFYSWTKIPQQFDIFNLGYLGSLVWPEPLPKKGGQITLIPYLNANTSREFEEHTVQKLNFGFGGDAKITLSSSLNLDLTANPDFSQVEVDRQVTNLTRFNVFFPERRNFFLENADVFSQFGDPGNPIFFSRRIGLDNDGNAVPILGGVRLSGNMGETWRIGVLSMQTKGTAEQAGQNYSALTLHKKVLKRSLIKGLVTNRQAVDGIVVLPKDYGRNASLEMIYQNEKGSLFNWLGLHKSFKHDLKDKNGQLSAGVWYNDKNFSTVTGIGSTGTNFTADMGFVNQIDNYDSERDTVIRQGFNSAFSFNQYILRTPDHKFINQHQFSLNNSFKFLPGETSLLDWSTSLEYELSFKSSSEIEWSVRRNQLQLLYPFSFTDGSPLPPGKYSYANVNAEYRSDLRKRFGFTMSASAGSFYNGSLTAFTAGMLYRAQPWGNFEVNFEFNDLDFPDPFGRDQLILINPRIEFNFTKNLFWTTFLQYNTQADNFNINSRFQWRYKPMSDIYMVYTDNYAVKFWGPKNRSFVLKINYWLNI